MAGKSVEDAINVQRSKGEDYPSFVFAKQGICT